MRDADKVKVIEHITVDVLEFCEGESVDFYRGSSRLSPPSVTTRRASMGWIRAGDRLRQLGFLVENGRIYCAEDDDGKIVPTSTLEGGGKDAR